MRIPPTQRPQNPAHRHTDSKTLAPIHLPIDNEGFAQSYPCMSDLEKMLSRHFEAGTVGRGRAYWRSGYVRSLKSKELEANRIELRSEVEGSIGTYKQSILIDQAEAKIVGECSCPVGVDCKHVVAVVLAFAAEADAAVRVDAQENSTTAESSGELQQLAKPIPRATRAPISTPLPYAIEVWLAKVAEAQSNFAESYPSDVAQRLLYVFGHANGQQNVGGILQVFKARAKKTGEFSDVSGYSNTHAYFNPPRYMLQSDTQILRQLSALTGRGYSFQFPLVDVGVDLVRAVVTTQRAFWLEVTRPPLTWGEPRPGTIQWVTLSNGDRQPMLVTAPIAVTLASTPPVYVDPETNTCGLIETPFSAAVAVAVAAAPALPVKWMSRVAQELQSRHLHQSIPLPTTLVEKTLDSYQPQPILHLQSHQRSIYDTKSWRHVVSHVETATLQFDYVGVCISGKNPTEITTVERDASGAESLVRVSRDFAFERAARSRLTGQGFVPAEKGLTRGVGRDMQGKLVFADATNDAKALQLWTAFLDEIVPSLRQAGWRIKIDADFRFDLTPITEWYADVDESGNRWFDLEIGIEVDGARVSLIPILVRLIQTSPVEWRPAAMEAWSDETKVIVPLGDGRRAALPIARLRPLLITLYELYLREPTGTRIRFSPLDAARLAEMDRALQLRWMGGARLRELGRRLARFEGIEPVAIPATFKANLRAYQQEGVAWLQFLREYDLAGILADDMGLGKTVQTLAHLLIEKEAGRMDLPSLVIAPTSMMTTWASEATRFAPSLSILVSHGVDRHARVESFATADVVLTTYALLARDEEKLIAQPWHMVVLDEAQNIKNSKTKAAAIACRLNARHRLCLTGTPMENHLGELWSLFRFLLPGLLGDEKTFQAEYRRPIEKEGDIARQQFLARRVHPFLLRRTKDLVAHELPAKTLVTRAITLDSAQADLYETVRAAMDKRVREEIAAKGIAKSHIVVLDALLKLRQICCDPRLLKSERKTKPPPSAKLGALLEMLEELLAEGRAILLFSQFTSMLELIEVELDGRRIAYAKLTGATQNRKKPVDDFQNGKVKLFLISLKAGGTGLTLTAADTVIHYDPWWNPAVENQATDRAHRIGQTKPVFVYKLIAEGTLEERIVEMQNKKGALTAGLLDGEENAAKALDATDLQALFAPIQDGSVASR